MSTFGVDQPAQENNQQPSPSSSMFSSLPEELVLEVLARAPPRNYPILSYVSKNFRKLVRSPEIYKIRSLLGRDSLYICFLDETKIHQFEDCYKWFRIENNKTENRFASVDLGFPYDSEPSPSVIAVGPEIFFICGSHVSSRSLYIFDSRSGKLRRGPDMGVTRYLKSVGLVAGKIFVIGGIRSGEIEAESFDLKKKIWETAPIPEARGGYLWWATRTVSLDRKICVLRIPGEKVTVYDPRNGSCESFKLPKDKWWEAGACTIHNLLYVYFARLGLSWYDSNHKRWRVVNGLGNLNLPKVGSLAMAEFYGKLAILWVEEESQDVSVATKIIWCRMISLSTSKEGIHGTAESSQSLGTLPRSFKFSHCLSLSV